MAPSTSAPTSRPARLLVRLGMLAMLLLAFALRAYRLDFQSFWSDEGISLQRASQPLAAMLDTMPVEHTPGYFVILNGWLRLAGEQDFALRYIEAGDGLRSDQPLAESGCRLCPGQGQPGNMGGL